MPRDDRGPPCCDPGEAVYDVVGLRGGIADAAPEGALPYEVYDSVSRRSCEGGAWPGGGRPISGGGVGDGLGLLATSLTRLGWEGRSSFSSAIILDLLAGGSGADRGGAAMGADDAGEDAR